VELLSRSGIAILNADDPNVLALASRTPAKVITFGCSPDADLRAIDVSGSWPERLSLTVVYGPDKLRIRSKFVGEHWTTSILAAIACGIACGVGFHASVKVIQDFEPLFGRYSVHVKPNGPVYIFDHKAPYWTIAASLAFVKAARAPRRTIVFGTISDYPGNASKRYRRLAREALKIADRVVFVGLHSGHVNALPQAEAKDRLFTFTTTYEANAFLVQEAMPEELICIKGSMSTDHLERIILSQLDRVVCWQERCGRECVCTSCSYYRIPHQPPLGLPIRSGELRSSENIDRDWAPSQFRM
jgi:UDP-N-acetylmuramoyl-tripeptide--D-alanyl-D-alanine ligase